MDSDHKEQLEYEFKNNFVKYYEQYLYHHLKITKEIKKNFLFECCLVDAFLACLMPIKEKIYFNQTVQYDFKIDCCIPTENSTYDVSGIFDTKEYTYQNIHKIIVVKIIDNIIEPALKTCGYDPDIDLK